ncbi:MAG: hypothetical protein KAR06_06485, partial [Deltaproteobacteria bacterium]|nr:hypothetical protein [Deltaproteobacteria bacterium]
GQVRQGISEAGRQEKTPTPPRPTDIRKQIRQIENDIRKARTGDQNSIAALVAAYSGVPQEQASEADTELFIQKLEDEKTLLNNLLPEKFRIKPRKVAPARTPKPRTPGPGASPAGDGEVDKFINKYVR